MSEPKKSLAEAIGAMAELGAVFAGEVMFSLENFVLIGGRISSWSLQVSGQEVQMAELEKEENQGGQQEVLLEGRQNSKSEKQKMIQT